MTPNGGAGTSTGSKADQARNHPALEWLAKIGTAIYGVMYVVVGWLAIQIAFGESEGKASGSGALRQIAEQPFGEVLLWAACAGFAALVVWKGFEAAAAHRGGRRQAGRRRGAHLGGQGPHLRGARRARLPDRHRFWRRWWWQQRGGLHGQAVEAAVRSRAGGRGRPGDHRLRGVQRLQGPEGQVEKSLEAEGHTGDIGTAITVLARTGCCSRGLAFAVIGDSSSGRASPTTPRSPAGSTRRCSSCATPVRAGAAGARRARSRVLRGVQHRQGVVPPPALTDADRRRPRGPRIGPTRTGIPRPWLRSPS